MCYYKSLALIQALYAFGSRLAFQHQMKVVSMKTDRRFQNLNKSYIFMLTQSYFHTCWAFSSSFSLFYSVNQYLTLLQEFYVILVVYHNLVSLTKKHWGNREMSVFDNSVSFIFPLYVVRLFQLAFLEEKVVPPWHFQ